MVAIKKLSIQNIRSHQSFTTDLSNKVTVITGQNGSGKTSLMEAIYIALQGSSFRGSDNDLLRADSPWWRIDIVLDNDTKRTISFNPEKQTSKKQFIVDGITTYRLPQKHKYPIVLFEPDDLRLLNGSPTRRRQFIDRFISQLNPLYLSIIRKYERALKQRNNLLKKQYIDTDELFVWDVALSEYGAYIIEQRIAFIEEINNKLNNAYDSIAGTKDTVSVHYSHTFIGDIKQKVLNELHANSARDKILGSTSIGPHRHDIIFKFNNSPAVASASRGEVRTIILALKFLEVDIIEKMTGNPPLILLDDVFSELDATRQKALSDTIRAHQIIITSTDVVPGKKNYKHIIL
ncbi:DNA replication/repair protein RecF [Patescibacteria group bacterium]|nr:MAG: DNA replication/repair protein RecF [Patescibacteria group bacterium]